MDHDKLVAGLRAWTKGHDPHVKAAVELLIRQEGWLRRPSFQAAAIGRDSVEAWVRWPEAREYLSSDEGMAASSSERALLDVAVAIGSDRYRLSRMDDRQAELVVTAFATALGMGAMLRD